MVPYAVDLRHGCHIGISLLAPMLALFLAVLAACACMLPLTCLWFAQTRLRKCASNQPIGGQVSTSWRYLLFLFEGVEGKVRERKNAWEREGC